jgi:hypothetical protein
MVLGLIGIAGLIVSTIMAITCLAQAGKYGIRRMEAVTGTGFLTAIPLCPLQHGKATSYVAAPFSESEGCSLVDPAITIPLSMSSLSPIDANHQVVLIHNCWNYHVSLSVCDESGNCSFQFESARELNLSDPVDHSTVKPAPLTSHLPGSFFQSEETTFVLCPVSTFHTRKHYLEPRCRHSPVPYRARGEFEMSEVGSVQWDKVGGDVVHLILANFTCLPRDYLLPPQAYWAALRDNTKQLAWLIGATISALIFVVNAALLLGSLNC